MRGAPVPVGGVASPTITGHASVSLQLLNVHPSPHSPRSVAGTQNTSALSSRPSGKLKTLNTGAVQVPCGRRGLEIGVSNCGTAFSISSHSQLQELRVADNSSPGTMYLMIVHLCPQLPSLPLDCSWAFPLPSLICPQCHAHLSNVNYILPMAWAQRPWSYPESSFCSCPTSSLFSNLSVPPSECTPNLIHCHHSPHPGSSPIVSQMDGYRRCASLS